MSGARVVPGALFRLPDGTTGIVEIVGGTVIGRNWHDGGLRRFEYHANTIDRHIICEPGDGPIRGNDAALADAQARAVRMEAERDAARAERDAEIQQREAEYRAGINALAGERDEARAFLAAVTAGQTEAIRERDEARAQLVDAQVSAFIERDAARAAADAQPVTVTLTIGGRTVTLTIGGAP